MKNKITAQKISCVNSNNEVRRIIEIKHGKISVKDFEELQEENQNENHRIEKRN